MAKAYAHCATEGCTHTIMFIEQNRKLADRKAEWAESQGFICSDCQDKQRQTENAKAAEQNQAAGLPELTGSDKQIAWAETIRAQKLETIRQSLAGELDHMMIDAYWGSAGWHQEPLPVDHPHAYYAIDLLKQQTSASWWIDRRDSKIGFILRELFVANPPAAEVKPEQKAIIDEAKLEATVRPANPVTETVAEITINGQYVRVSFPEKRENFRLIMHKYHFRWDNNRWQRLVSALDGTTFDRAAEIGHFLLAHGYIVRQFNADIRNAMIHGYFEACQTRWIALFTSGKEQGRLCIRWERKDEDYWKVAKRLPTARYAKPHISVAIEQFEQVLDFAEVNGFSITAAAREAMAAAKQAKDAALVVDVRYEEPDKRGDDGEPVELEVPSDVEVDDDLRD
jgi:hypothetical protein